MRASVIVVVHSGRPRLDDAVASLEPYSTRFDVEVILVDNASPDHVDAEARRRFPWLRIVRSERNLGFAGGVNLGAEQAGGEILVLLNDDAAAEDGLVEAHLELLLSHPQVAATAGRLVSWNRSRHDFVRGMVTFDSHAFQLGQGVPVDAASPPAEGEPLPFACGGNVAIRREDWTRCKGFDADLFAYFEDVELGWRLWAMGRQIVSAPRAVARHRGAATSAGLGNFRRGVLFERNALRTFFACADEEHRAAMGPAVMATFLHRLVRFAEQSPELASWIADPFHQGSPPLPSRSQRWRRRIERHGLIGGLRHLLGRVMLGRVVGHPRIDEGHFLMQLRAAHGFFAGLDATTERHRALAAQRVLSDRELIARFPRLVVPTYQGDEPWFASDAFRSLLPGGWPLTWRKLDEVMHPDAMP